MFNNNVLLVLSNVIKMMRLATCTLLVLFVGLLAGCGQQQSQNDKSIGMDSVIFTRTGLFLKMNEPVAIKEVNVSKDGQKVAAKTVNTKGDALINFDWNANTKYDLEVVTGKGKVNMPVYSSEKSSPVKIVEIPLEELDKGEMEYRYYASRGAEVCFSPDGEYVAVGSKGGYIYLVNVKSKDIVWKNKISEGRACEVAFTSDGKLLAGEESRDGYLYCYDVKTGKMLWQYKTCSDFGAENDQVSNTGRYKNYPFTIWGLCIDKNNNPYVLARYSGEREIKGKKIPVSEALVYKFDINNGQPVWKFPIKSSAWSLRISEDGKYVIPSVGWAQAATVYVLDGSSGKPFWEHTFTFPEKDPESFRGKTGFEARISPDNKYVVVNQVYPDYTFVFDNEKSVQTGQPQLLWKKKFLQVLDVGGVPIGVSTVNLKLTDKDIIFATWSTRAMGPTANDSQLPAQHPDADTLFVYDYDGNLKWKWKMGEGTWNKDCILSKDGTYMVIPIGLVPETPFANPQDMGIYVFSPEVAGGATAKLDWFYHTEGFAYKVDVSPDNNCIAVLEGPFDIDPDRMKENIVGKHRLIILS